VKSVRLPEVAILNFTKTEGRKNKLPLKLLLQGPACREMRQARFHKKDNGYRFAVFTAKVI
jgi:hypothetical protein